MEGRFILPDPGGQLLLNDLPDSVLTLHPEHDPVTPVISHVHREHPLRQTIRFAEIELSQTAIGLYQFGELYVPDELYLHKAPLLDVMINSRATYRGGFLKNSEFFSRRGREDEFRDRAHESP